MTETTFTLTAQAQNFVTRDRAKVMRDQLLKFESAAPRDVALTIDLSGIEVLTPSFADEFFGKTVLAMGLSQFRGRFRIVGATDTIKLLISKVIKIRLNQSASQTVSANDVN